MKISTRGRYAVMAMTDMAHQVAQGSGGPFSLSEIGKRQEISINYLEQIFGDLRRAGLVESQRGAQGGYRLAEPAQAIYIGDVIHAVDESIDITRCQAAGGCLSKHARCLTHDLWARLGNHIHGFLNGISLADVIDGQKTGTPDIQSLDVQSLDVQSLDVQSLDVQSLDVQSLDVQSLDAQNTPPKSKAHQ